MTPEDKIVEAIDRLTEEVKSVRNYLIWGVILISTMMVARATPLTPPLAQPPLFDIGDPPKPPPNPNLQHWYTMDVPGPNGVLPVEVFAPRLYSPVASAGPVDVDVPELNTTWMLIIAIVVVLAIRTAWKDTSKL